MGVEFELKFQATEESLAAIRKGMSVPEQVISMQTLYYDTPDGTLSAQGLTLRKRTENGRVVCTLKTPAGALGRGEFELECDRIEDAVPQLCRESGIAEPEALTQQKLMVVCGARFTRYAYGVCVPGGKVEVALDTGILSGGGREIPLCEVEVELKEGTREATVAYAMDLAGIHGLQSQPKSKFRRALALYRAGCRGESNE
ncbi:MAG: CYTH domain-containing protein [Oscillospiraceae bacterium]|nr:CYTH domain-containing protein [Oscillospiraceae bacterium]